MVLIKFSILLLTLAFLKETQAQTCGVVNFPNNVKIVGGVIANQGSWPSIAYISWNYKAYYQLPTGVIVLVTASKQCDGTLIATNKVLTAAHCIPTSVRFSYGGVTYVGPVFANSFYPTLASSYSVFLGLQDKTSIVTSGTYSAPTVKSTVSSFVANPSFNPTYLTNDIALLKLSSPVTLNNYIQIACLPTAQSTTYPGVGLSVYAAGWGLLSSSSATTPNQLYNVKLTTYPAANCPYQGYFDAGTICAGLVTGGKGVCQGDSGGPLFYFDPSVNIYVLAGITSFTNSAGCGLAGAQSGFTRVSDYLSWINSQTLSKRSIEESPIQHSANVTVQMNAPSSSEPTVTSTIKG
jgi:secreted trypsin-like serine protease